MLSALTEKLVCIADPRREAIVTLLKQGVGVNMDADLSCYPTHDGWFMVDYIFMEDTIDKLNLTEEERRLCLEEEELIEMFETAEQAVDFYLRLSGNNGSYNQNKGVKRNLRDKLRQTQRDSFFS